MRTSSPPSATAWQRWGAWCSATCPSPRRSSASPSCWDSAAASPPPPGTITRCLLTCIIVVELPVAPLGPLRKCPPLVVLHISILTPSPILHYVVETKLFLWFLKLLLLFLHFSLHWESCSNCH